jgi:hypothetical protein
MEGVRLLDVVQLCCRTAATCSLRVTNGTRSGCLWLAGGDIVHAESGGLRGEDAAMAILTWRGGSFVVDNRATTAETSITTNGERLVMLAACALDETKPTAPEDEPASAPEPASAEPAPVAVPVEAALAPAAAPAGDAAEAARQSRIAGRGEVFYGLSGEIGAVFGLGLPLAVHAKGTSNRISVEVDEDGSARVSAGPLRLDPPLTEAPGREGSFVLDDSGAVLASDLPGALDAALREVGAMVLELRQATSLDGDSCRSFELQYGEYTLFGRRIAGGFLCILSRPAVAATDVRQALAVITRQLQALR